MHVAPMFMRHATRLPSISFWSFAAIPEMLVTMESASSYFRRASSNFRSPSEKVNRHQRHRFFIFAVRGGRASERDVLRGADGF